MLKLAENLAFSFLFNKAELQVNGYELCCIRSSAIIAGCQPV